MKKLEKKSSEAFNKGSSIEDSDKKSNHGEESDDEHRAKKDRFLGLISIGRIQNFKVNAAKPQLGGGSYKTHLYTKSYMKCSSYALWLSASQNSTILTVR